MPEAKAGHELTREPGRGCGHAVRRWRGRRALPRSAHREHGTRGRRLTSLPVGPDISGKHILLHEKIRAGNLNYTTERSTLLHCQKDFRIDGSDGTLLVCCLKVIQHYQDENVSVFPVRERRSRKLEALHRTTFSTTILCCPANDCHLSFVHMLSCRLNHLYYISSTALQYCIHSYTTPLHCVRVR